MPPLRCALFQSTGRVKDVAGNLAALDRAAARAADRGARLLVTNELFLTGYGIGADVARLAQPADGPAAEAVAAVARRHRLAVAYGYPERDGELLHNAVQLIGADGERLAHYRKTHLFGDFERTWFTPGDQHVVQADWDGVRVGILICYDVEFPENTRAHALAGTELLLVPTALMHPFGFVAERLVPVRAFENQMYLAYVNRTGEEPGHTFLGRSALIGPDGLDLARAGAGEELVTADADPAVLTAARHANPYLHDRRPDLYHTLT